MSNKSRKLSNPFSTGNGGGHFEAHIQASFVTLMLTGGYSPCFPFWPITEIKLQGKIDGFDTDDLIVYVTEPGEQKKHKMLGQIKHKITVSQGDSVFSEVIKSAWNDFNNPKVFSKDIDKLALLTGPLSATDTHNVLWLLNQARHTKDVNEFERHVKQSNFSPPRSEEKLEIIKYHLKLANNNNEVTKEDYYSFLNHFYILGYDLGKDEGIAVSLLHSHISQFNREYPHWVWPRIVDIVHTWNQNAGTITSDKLSNDLKQLFMPPAISYIPAELINTQSSTSKANWNSHQHATFLAKANLLGAWDEKKDADITILNQILNEEYSVYVLRARELVQLPDSPLSLWNGLWKVTERTVLWDMLSSRIFDQDLDTLKAVIVSVLTERDPSFELSPEERYAANIRGKMLTHSQSLRKGLAESLALMGNKEKVLINCSRKKAEVLVILAIREIFDNSDCILWGSLNSLLPILSEAAPDEFLRAVENALCIEPCPFDELFAQEGYGITGQNYMAGLLWALENLAWDESLLVRVCIILGELACHDPGGNWSNRPINSLTTILLPWFPQTMATINKRKVAVQTLCKECPDISWKLIISLLPSQHQMSAGSHKPIWRDTIPRDWEEKVTHQEYWEQVAFYMELAVSMANKDQVKLIEIIDHFDNLSKPSFERLLKILSSTEILSLSEGERFPIWDKLIKFISNHRYFSDTEWALDEKWLLPIEEVANKLAPSSPLYLFHWLFSDYDVNLYKENMTWDEHNEKISEQRHNAVVKILNYGGLDAVIRFAEAVQFTFHVGEALGCIADPEIDKVLLPKYLQSYNNNHIDFIRGYVLKRHYINGWPWIDMLDKTNWNNLQIREILCCLPFAKDTWDRAEQWLYGIEIDYWHKVNPNPYQAGSNIKLAIDKLISYGRPHAAIDCLFTMHHLKEPIAIEQCVRALMEAVFSPEPQNTLRTHTVIALIKLLQETPEVPQDDLFRVEWAYLPILDRYHGAAPKILENRLADDPELFCEAIRLIFRSNKDDSTSLEPTKETHLMAANALQLLYNWRILPGMQQDGSFSGEHFSIWLQRVKEICAETGHLDVGLLKVGAVLIHCPTDPDGLWINHSVANELNARDVECMRRGFSIGIYNARGVHYIDSSGKPEYELSKQYMQKAEDVENAGYQRLAVTLRNLAESYEHEAEYIVDKNKNS